MKIFGIGLSKTGTTSLHEACLLLDMRSIHYPPPRKVKCGDISLFTTYDVFVDISISAYYKRLDINFPEAKFILTVRDLNAWKKSASQAFSREIMESRKENTPGENELNKKLYGWWWYKEPEYPQAFVTWNEHVLTYFKTRTDLLVLDICAGDGWEKLCPFLGCKTIPIIPFPFANKRRKI